MHTRTLIIQVDEIEAVTNHDVIAFLTNMGSYIDAKSRMAAAKPNRWVHYGMTSTDLLSDCFVISSRRRAIF